MLPVLGRHLLRSFFSTFALAMTAFIAIYVVADFFDRLDTFLSHDAPAGTIIKLFLFKLPLIVTQVTPIAVLVGALVGLGLLARQNEFVAMRACGVSIWQIAVPLTLVAAIIGVLAFAWNETVVPYSARRWHAIENLDIKKRQAAMMFTGREVWYHGRAGFYNIERVAPRRNALYGVTVYQLGQDFRPTRVIEIDEAHWDGTRWLLFGSRTREFRHGTVRDLPRAPSGFTLPEALDDFRAVSVEPEELSYQMLRRQMKDLRRKGVDTSEGLVDLHLKLSLPAASLIMMLVAVPLAAAGTRVSSFTTSIGLGFALGFGYFVVMAFARALGQTGALPPVMAAWSANGLFALIGGFYALGAD
jgi:lipopolysaccharide export system permease protein